MFLFWGRRGALSVLTRQIGEAAARDPGFAMSLSVSRQNEMFPSFAGFGPALHSVDTFTSGLGAVANAWRIPWLCRALEQRLEGTGTRIVIDLMPHVWSPFLQRAVRRAGARYVALVHDANAHPGDPSRYVKWWIDWAALRADTVLTLSASVADKLRHRGRIPGARIATLFHPDLHYETAAPRIRTLTTPAPLRFMFLGRILPYKGLRLLVETFERLTQRGVPVRLGIFGEGDMQGLEGRLHRLGAEIVNRWLTESEISAALRGYDAMVLSHLEASQSGVAAAAFGANMPIVCTPVGGLVEQVKHGITGMISAAATPAAMADAISALAGNQPLYNALSWNIAETKGERSTTRFVRECAAIVA